MAGRYATKPDVAADIRSLKARVRTLEVKVANLGPQPGGSPGSTFDSNVIWNGSMESGITGYGRLFFAGSIGVPYVEDANPLSGLRSLRVDEQASSSTDLIWCPTSNHSAPTVGSDVFATAPGEVWQVMGTMRSSVDTTHARINALCGLTAGACYGLSNVTYVAAADLSLTAGVITQFTGQITVPASRNFITFGCNADNRTGTSAVPWSWWLDEVVLQRKLS